MVFWFVYFAGGVCVMLIKAIWYSEPTRQDSKLHDIKQDTVNRNQ